MRIVADDRIPFLRGVFEPWCEVVYLPGRAITPAEVADADALIVRTRTRCDRALLGASRVRLVATATGPDAASMLKAVVAFFSRSAE